MERGKREKVKEIYDCFGVIIINIRRWKSVKIA